jgi:hypothetical protein
MSYFAQFEEIESHSFRLDTRIYLRDEASPSDEDVCIAATIGKNHGSAKGTLQSTLAPVKLDGG